MPKKNVTRFIAALGTAASLLSAGCAEDVGDIDRTQENLLPKSMFAGSWYVHQTVSEVPVTSLFSFVGESGDIEKIRWEIQEDMLVGYRDYEHIPGADARPDTEGAGADDPQGSPIVAYPILEHVDVIRDYNARTGEQTNVVAENTTDRPWHERAFIRVDWSAPQVRHWFFYSTADRDATDAATYVRSSEGGADAFRVCHRGDEACTDGRHSDGSEHGEPYYVDFTERLFVRPDVQGCILDLNNLGVGDCAAQEVRVRTSFLKVDPAREADFVPVVYDDERQGEFGFFRTERVTYDRRRGATHSGLVYLANVHDIWKNSVDAEGNPRPFAERGLRPIVYHLSPNYPAEMRAVTDRIQAEYDASFKRIASFRKGKSVEEIESELEAEYGRSCLFCVDANEDGAARIGDLRYNFIYWVDHPQLVSPLGYGPSFANPETGRIISGTAYVYGAAIDTQATYAKDVVDLLTGRLEPDDVIGGQYIRDEIVSRYTPTDPRRLEELAAISIEDALPTIFGADAFARLSDVRTFGLPEARPGWTSRRMERIRGTALEPMLLNEEILRSHDFDPAFLTDPDASIVDAASPVRWATPEALQRINTRRRLLEKECVWMSDFGDPSISGLAQAVASMGLEGDALWQYLREEIYMGVMLHEIGHTVGLRHNFGASSDALNYHEEYWPLREQTFLGRDPRTVEDLMRLNCSAITPENEEACAAQVSGRMSEYQYASIMDYGAKFNSDFHGLGRYDVAALAAAYGDIVEVFPTDVVDQMPSGFRGDLRVIASWRNPLFGSLADYYHHTFLPELFGGVENLGRREWVARENFDMDAEEGPVRVPYVACYDEYRDATATCHTWDEGADTYEISRNWIRSYREYYVLRNFQRDRLGFDPYDVFTNVATRYFLPLTNMYQHWLFDYTGQSSVEQVYSALGAQDGFQLIAEVLSTPRYGSYERDASGLYVWQSYDRGMADLDIEPGPGRRAYSRYDIEAGYNIFNRVVESGLFYEQLAALLALTESDASALGVGADVQADFLSYSIPYYLVFPDAINELFSGVIRRDYAQFAPRIADDGSIVYPNYLSEDPSSTEGTPIDLELPFSTQIYTLLYGMASLSVNYDLGFVQRGQVAILGTGETIEPAPGFEAVTYADPFSGRVYAAYRSATNPDDNWYAADKVEELNAAREAWEAAPEGSAAKQNLEYFLQSEVEDLEIMRGMYDAFGFVW